MALKILRNIGFILFVLTGLSCKSSLTGIGIYSTEYVYNFDNDNLIGWYGTANSSIINGELLLDSRRGFVWHNIETNGDSSYVKGKLELDVFLQSGSYLSIETKGGLLKNNQLDWGIFTQFSRDSLFVVKLINYEPKAFFTGYVYQNQKWYHLKFIFDSEAGAQGRYKLWIQPFGDEEKYLGEYDYRNGRLKGVHILALSLGDIQFLENKQVLIDNIHFSFE